MNRDQRSRFWSRFFDFQKGDLVIDPEYGEHLWRVIHVDRVMITIKRITRGFTAIHPVFAPTEIGYYRGANEKSIRSLRRVGRWGS